MPGCIDTDSIHSTLFPPLTNPLCTKPLIANFPSTDMPDPAVIDFIKKTFYITAYILLYLLSTIVSGLIGHVAAHVAEKWILALYIPDRLKANRDYVEVTRELCVLICSTGFLIVAVGLLFMHLVGGLPHEYDELLAQIGIAFFGEVVFVVLCLGALFVGFGAGMVLVWVRGFWRGRVADEEEGLVKRSKGLGYGSAEDVEGRREVDAERRPRVESERRPSVPKTLCRPWIKMKTLSSVRELDVRRIERSFG